MVGCWNNAQYTCPLYNCQAQAHFRSNVKPDQSDPPDVRQTRELGQTLLGQRTVQAHERQGLSPRRSPAQAEAGDIDTVVRQYGTHLSQNARLV